MKNPLMWATSGDLSPSDLRRAIQEDDGRDMALRRAITAVSLVGITSMAVVSLFQMGAIKHLPDPPTKRPNWRSDQVNSSDEAYGWGMPDAPLTVFAHGANMSLAAAGPPDRWRNRPWLPVLATLGAAAQAAVAAKYLFYQMPKVEKAWCPYCIVDALTHFATLALTVPETVKAVRGLSR
ncbi:MAG: vitamin K epoxide reductase family protein [Proteobacteria bacterium]|nr:vitamin K epoxide reductase family protein [Pseudomonadota bacterium]MBW3616365.1 vitamin K epoxide reductase family protein [Pseudomonadota bacterium]